MKTLTLTSLLACAFALTVTGTASAQFGQGFHSGGNYWENERIDRRTVQGTHVERPGALVVGGLLNGIGAGLHQSNPQQNGVASSILGGLGAALEQSSNSTHFRRDTIERQRNGGFNNFQYYGP